MGTAKLILYSIGIAVFSASFCSYVWMHLYEKALLGYASKGKLLGYTLMSAVQFVVFLFAAHICGCF